eukprot:3295229-Pleurochrysis_carterae.AAC.1
MSPFDRIKRVDFGKTAIPDKSLTKDQSFRIPAFERAAFRTAPSQQRCLLGDADRQPADEQLRLSRRQRLHGGGERELGAAISRSASQALCNLRRSTMHYS